MDDDRTASLMSPAKLAQMKPKPATTPAAWLTQMAADAGHLHVRRIGEIGDMLKAQARMPGLGTVASHLEELAEVLPRLDFSLLEPQGWWARTSGKSKSSGSEFATQFEHIDAAAADVASAASALPAGQPADAAQLERTLVELEVEYRAVEKIIDQGARWLQDMQSQLKARHAAGVDAAAHQQIRDDAARCEILVARLKLLRDAIGHAQQSHRQALATAVRRQAVLRQVQACKLKEWRASLAALSITVAEGDAPQVQVDTAQAAQASLETALAESAAGLHQLMDEERTLAGGLGVLTRELRSAA